MLNNKRCWKHSSELTADLTAADLSFESTSLTRPKGSVVDRDEVIAEHNDPIVFVQETTSGRLDFSDMFVCGKKLSPILFHPQPYSCIYGKID